MIKRTRRFTSKGLPVVVSMRIISSLLPVSIQSLQVSFLTFSEFCPNKGIHLKITRREREAELMRIEGGLVKDRTHSLIRA